MVPPHRPLRARRRHRPVLVPGRHSEAGRRDRTRPHRTQLHYAGIPLVGITPSVLDAALIQHVEDYDLGLRFSPNGAAVPDGPNLYLDATRTGDIGQRTNPLRGRLGELSGEWSRAVRSTRDHSKMRSSGAPDQRNRPHP